MLTTVDTRPLHLRNLRRPGTLNVDRVSTYQADFGAQETRIAIEEADGTQWRK